MSLLTMSIAGAVMILVVILIRVLLIDKLPKRTFIILWMIVIARLLIPIEIASKTSVYNLRPEIMINTESTMNIENNAPATVATNEVNYDKPIEEGKSLTNQVELLEVQEPVKTFKLSSNQIWFIGAAILYIYFAYTYNKSRRILDTSIPCEDERIIEYVKSISDRNIDIRWLDRINTAITYGIFKPIIVLPKRLENADDETMEKILLHEHYHIDSYDSIKKLLMVATLIVHWFNPLVWIMYIIFNRDMELYCDERVLVHLGRDERADYAYTLIEQADNSNTFSLSSGFSKNALEERVRSVMKYKKSTVITIGLAVVILIGVVIFFATSKRDERYVFTTMGASVGSEDDFSVSVSYNKIDRTPLYYLDTSDDQEVEIHYNFRYSDGTVISFENSKGEVSEVAKSEDDPRIGTLKLIEGMNRIFIESKGQVGSFSMSGVFSEPEKIIYAGYETKEEDKKRQLKDFNEETYKNFGLELNKSDSKLYYNGKAVRRFYDLVEKNRIDERFHHGVKVDYMDRTGDIYLYAIREEGELLRLVEVEDADEFDWLKSSWFFEYDEILNPVTEEEKFSIYRNYALRYDAEKDKLYYMDKLVKEFSDIRKTPTNEATNIEYSDDKGEVYVYTVRDNSRVGVNGLGGLVNMYSTDDEAEYRKVLKKTVEEPYSYYKNSFSDELKEDYDEIIKDMNITIDSVKYIDERDESNPLETEYLIEVKLHYGECEDLSKVELSARHLNNTQDNYLQEYIYEGKTETKIEDGIVYITKYYGTEKGYGNLALNFNLRRPHKYVGYYSIETPIGNGKTKENIK